MKTFTALLIAALFTTAACNKKKQEAGTADPKADPAAKATEPPKADTPTPDPAKAADPAAKAADPAAKAADPAAGGGMSVDEAGTKATALMEKIGAAVTAAKGDCTKMGESLKAFVSEVKELGEQGKAIDNDPAKKKEFDEKYGEKIKKQMEGWGNDLGKCGDNADVKALFTAME